MNLALNILIVEDNTDDIFLLQQALKKANVKSCSRAVCDGVEARSYLEGEGGYADRSGYPFPDIILLDVNMPRMNGFELLQWLRQDPKCCRLVVHILSSSARKIDVERAYDLGANSYLVKPSRIDDLVDFAKALQQWHRFICLPVLTDNRKPMAEAI